MVHGAFSARRVDPLAARHVERLLALPDCPEHVRQPRFEWTLTAWARTESVVELLVDWIARMVAESGLESALGETTAGSEDTSVGKARVRKVSSSRRVESALVLLDRAERRAQSLRAEMGITPAAAARMGLPLAEKGDSLLSQVLRIQLEQGDGAA